MNGPRDGTHGAAPRVEIRPPLPPPVLAMADRLIEQYNVPREKAVVAAEQHYAKQGRLVESPAPKRKKVPKPSPEGFRRAFKHWCHEQGLPLPVFEEPVVKGRRWAWDVAWPSVEGTGGVAIDIQGGGWVRGAHHRPRGYENDVAKRHAGEAAGWRVFYRTWENLASEDTAAMLRPALEHLTRADVAASPSLPSAVQEPSPTTTLPPRAVQEEP